MATLAPDRAAVLAAVAHPEALATIVTIDGPDGPEPFELWEDQRALLRTILTSHRVLVLKARQLGVTWTLALLALWWALAHPGQTVLIVSIGEREAADVLRRIRRLYDSLPAIVREHFPLGQSNATRLEVSHPEGPGVIVSLPSSSSAGRGQTVHLLIGDERPKWPNAAEQEASLLPAAADAGRVVLGGTANGMDGFYERWMAAPGNGWAPVFIGALSRPGRTEEWVRVEREQLGDLGPQEFPLSAHEAFLASGRCAFDRDRLESLRAIACEPSAWRGRLVRDVMHVMAEDDERGDWWVWEWPEPGRQYLIAADACGGHGSDYAAAAVYDRDSWEQVAAYHARVEPSTLAAELVKAGWMYQSDGTPALLAPEVNNHGQGVIVLLLEWGYPSLYHREVFDQHTKMATRKPGWETTEKSRHQLVSALQLAIGQGTLVPRDAAFIAEAHRFIWRETPRGGRYEADAGANDDRVITHGIANVVLSLSAQGTPAGPPPALPVPDPANRTGYTPG